MINKNEWLNNEMFSLKKAEKKITTFQFFLLSVLIGGFGAFTALECKDDFFCEKVDELDTWKCTKCGFKNYEGIEKCGICGKRRL